MNNMEKQNLIIKKLVDNGWQVEEVSYVGRCSVTASKKYANIQITTEECLCHGGRMWLTDMHTNYSYEISHGCYDESLGITDSSSELKYIIENEMMEYVNKYNTIVYKSVVINKYGKQINGLDEEVVRYYGSMKALANSLFEGYVDTDDIFTVEKEKKEYPNNNIYETVERVNKETTYYRDDKKIYFEFTRYERKDAASEFKKIRTYGAYVEIFNKG